MCLIAVAHRASKHFPLILAANRDEDYTRPTRDAHWWDDAPDVLGGRDLVQGGSWLAITKRGRIAAVTNLRGTVLKSRSRGALVRDFVTSSTEPRVFADSLVQVADEYSGFHLLAGEAGGEIVHVTPQGWTPLAKGVHAISNAPLGEHWPKTSLAVFTMKSMLQFDDEEEIVPRLMRFLTMSFGKEDVESEIFITGERYGTRASTVVLVSKKEIVFVEQTSAGRRQFRERRPPAG